MLEELINKVDELGGIRSQYDIDQDLRAFLSKTDWYITRKSETDTAIPSDISKYRADVRTATATIETKINNCSKLSELMALFDVPIDKDGNVTGKAPINDFPDEE